MLRRYCIWTGNSCDVVLWLCSKCYWFFSHLPINLFRVTDLDFCTHFQVYFQCNLTPRKAHARRQAWCWFSLSMLVVVLIWRLVYCEFPQFLWKCNLSHYSLLDMGSCCSWTWACQWTCHRNGLLAGSSSYHISRMSTTWQSAYAVWPFCKLHISKMTPCIIKPWLCFESNPIKSSRQ